MNSYISWQENHHKFLIFKKGQTASVTVLFLLTKNNNGWCSAVSLRLIIESDVSFDLSFSLVLHLILLGILPVLEGLLDLHVQVVPVHHVLSDLVNWQLNEHTGDLWCLVVTNDHLDVLVDATTDLSLQVRIVWVE